MDIIKTRDEFIELLIDDAKLTPSRFTIDEADEIMNKYFQYLKDRRRGYSLVTRERINMYGFIPASLLQLYLSYAVLVMKFWSKITKIIEHIAINNPTWFFCSMFLDAAENEWKWFGVIDGVRICLNERRVK